MSTFLFYKIYTNQPLTTIYKKAGKNNVQSNLKKIGFFVGEEKWTDKTGLVLQESENCSQ
jgi:hypothetical protein